MVRHLLGNRKYLFKQEGSSPLRLIALSLALCSVFLSNAYAQETASATPITNARENTGSSNLPAEDPFRALLTRRGPAAVKLSTRTPQLFETTQGDEAFVFQTDGRTGLIRFLCDKSDTTDIECALLRGQRGEEIYALTATRSPRGDVIYKDVDGEAVLRVTTNGGATLFSPSEKPATQGTVLVPLGGKAVLPVPNTKASLSAPALSYAEVEARMLLAADIFRERYGIDIYFLQSGPDGQRNQAVLADAVLTAAKGIDLVAADALGADALAKGLEMVRFVPGTKTSYLFDKKVLTITYAKGANIAGRPSSAAIARYLEATL
ncbi:MAG: DUF4908 domain-containing protein [Parvularculaceae bacterium]